MPDCKKLDPLVTPYVDGELESANRAEVDAHLRVCPPCHARVVVEQSVRDLLSRRKHTFKEARASASLRRRCEAVGADLPPSRLWRFGEPRRSSGDYRASVGGKVRTTTEDVVQAFRPALWRTHTKPLALAASLVLVVSAAFLYALTDRSNRVMAAELVADHMKCFGLNHLLNMQQEASLVEGAMSTGFGWRVQLPERPQRLGLELVGARPCLYAEGRVAHIMYRHNGHPVSVFMLPNTVRTSEVVDVMGHEAAIWPSAGRTFVLVAREPRAEVERMAAFVHAALK